MSDFVGKYISHYRIDARLGDGGMGTVYRAYDTNLERLVALKLMHAHYANQPEFQARLVQEARASAKLEHPSIVHIYDFGESDEGLFIAMEYVRDGNLRAYLMHVQNDGRYVDLKQSLQIGAQMAEALHYAHQKSVVHRDVKPGNILLKRLSRPDEPGEAPFRAILSDFGLVKLTEEGDHLTRTGMTLGTPTYMSPEQCEGRTLDGRSDLYSLGVVLYELFTNKLPFQFKSLSEAMATHMRGEMPIPAREIRSDLPPVIGPILNKLLAKAPSDRYQNGRELADELRSAMLGANETPTQVIVGGRPNAQADDLEKEVPKGFRLLIKTPGRESTHAALLQPTITLGRHVNNDIVLPADGVSRYHGRIQSTSTGWEIVDLGGVNGIWLGNRKLRPNISTPMNTGDVVHIGPYELVLEGSGTERPTTIPRQQNVELPTSLRQTEPYSPPGSQDSSDLPLEMFLARDTITVEPGRRAELKVEVVNRSPMDDRVNLRVYGISSDWVEAPDTFIDVPAGGTTPISIMFQPPRRAGTPAGRQRVRIELTSQQFRNLRTAVPFNLILDTFEDFSVEMTPRNLKVPGVVRVALRNTGNAAAEYSLVGREPTNHIQFQGERGRIRLNPNQVANVDLQLEPRSQSWFGGQETYGFEVEVASRSGARHTVSGNAEATSILPTSIGYAALVLTVFFLALAMLLYVYSFLNGGGRPGNQTTPGVNAATLAVIHATQTAATANLAGTATILAATAAVEGDNDNDGLNNDQEAALGTNPNNRDSDGDGLSDGDEVLIYGTTPTKFDSDGDSLSDAVEIAPPRTNPNNPDTDGDGINDNVEIANGTDPNNPASPASPTTTVQPTITPTPSGNLPDLIIALTPTITYEFAGCIDPDDVLGTRVIVQNVGATSAGSFIININTTQRSVTGLAAGANTSFWVPGYINPTSISVDATGLVNESNETNNTFNGNIAVPTQPPPCTTVTVTPATITPTGSPSPSPSASATGSPSPTPSETPTGTPTGTATGTSTATPTGTATVTATATDTPSSIVNPLVNCATIVPTLDGVMGQNEWGLLPIVEFGPQNDPDYHVNVYFLKDTANYYLAFEINDPSQNTATDSLRIYFDATHNAGDPDSADRFFQIARDGTLTIQAGINTNVDSEYWDNSYTSNNWTAVTGEPETGKWVVEMSIVAAEMPIMLDGNPFGMMALVLYTGLLHPWPDGAITNNAGTWQTIDNQVCP